MQKGHQSFENSKKGENGEDHFNSMENYEIEENKTHLSIPFLIGNKSALKFHEENKNTGIYEIASGNRSNQEDEKSEQEDKKSEEGNENNEEKKNDENNKGENQGNKEEDEDNEIEFGINFKRDEPEIIEENKKCNLSKNIKNRENQKDYKFLTPEVITQFCMEYHFEYQFYIEIGRISQFLSLVRRDCK